MSFPVHWCQIIETHPYYEKKSEVQLDRCLTFCLLPALGLVALVHAEDTVVGDLEDPAAVYHQVAALQVTVHLHRARVQVSHSLQGTGEY